MDGDLCIITNVESENLVTYLLLLLNLSAESKTPAHPFTFTLTHTPKCPPLTAVINL